ncbi:hypothetical protein FA95DRAFT_1563148, partial [Auriscalpium vulgare]
LIGKCVGFFLYGVLTAQIYSYHYNFADERKLVKILVWGVFILETIQTAMSIAEVYHWYADGFGDMATLERTYISPIDTPLITSLVSFVVQTFYCYRIYVLKPTLCWLSSLVASISLAQAISGIVGGIDGSAVHFAQAHEFIAPAYLWLIGDAVADIMIAVIMVSLLATFRIVEDSYTRRMVSRIMRLCVETNVASATVALLALILFVASPYYYLAP